MESLALVAIPDEARQKGGVLLFAAVAGFFFVIRVALTFLFFQANPVAGTVVVVIAGLALVLGALLYSSGSRAEESGLQSKDGPLAWIVAFLAVSLLSLAWGEAQSTAAAVAYWAALVADVATVLVMLRGSSVRETVEYLMMGAVWGGVALSLIGWCAPSTEDLRLGNDEFLHPNMLGLQIGLCALMAQYLARRGRGWWWVAIGLAVTLLRTLSKTAIVAFLIAEAWYMLQNQHLTRAARVRIGAAAGVVVACFWGLLSAYADAYMNGPGRQLETLTGRTLLWTVVVSMGLERPWLGHGFYSFKSLVPSLGEFTPVHAHNELLHLFFELGAVGVVVVIGIYATFLLRAWRSAHGEMRTLAIALWIFAVVRGLADAVPAELCFPLWLMAALTVFLGPAKRKAGAV